MYNNMPQMYFMSNWNNTPQPRKQAQPQQQAQPQLKRNLLVNRFNRGGNIYDMLEVIRNSSGSCKACGRG
jgi:hypothetical protein